jgi:P-type Ca2+ transporter type 2C
VLCLAPVRLGSNVEAADVSVAWHSLSAEDVAEKLKTDLSTGLTAEEVARRLRVFGPNVLQDSNATSILHMLASQFADPMISILILAAAVAGFLNEAADALTIVTIVLLNSAIGFYQEYRADKALYLLKQMTVTQSKAIREGKVTTLSATALVPGDIVLVEAGDAVPADLRIIEAVQLR